MLRRAARPQKNYAQNNWNSLSLAFEAGWYLESPEYKRRWEPLLSLLEIIEYYSKLEKQRFSTE